MPIYCICPARGCRRLTAGGRCPEHRRDERRRRQARAIERIYGSRRWRTVTRPAVLERDGYRCVLCGASAAEARLDVCHLQPTQALLAAGADVFDPDLCETRCARCHGQYGWRQADR